MDSGIRVLFAEVFVTAVAIILLYRVHYRIIRLKRTIFAPRLASDKESAVVPNDCIDLKALREATSRTKEMDSCGADLGLLSQAIEMIAAATKTKINKTLEKQSSERTVLRIMVTPRRKSRIPQHVSVVVERGNYISHHMSGPDYYTERSEETSKLAWYIVDGFTFLPAHVGAAVQRVQKEGGSDRYIPMSYIEDAAGHAATRYVKTRILRRRDVPKNDSNTETLYVHSNEQLTFHAAERLVADYNLGRRWSELRRLIRPGDEIWKHTFCAGIGSTLELIIKRDGEIIGQLPLQIDR